MHPVKVDCFANLLYMGAADPKPLFAVSYPGAHLQECKEGKLIPAQ
jgi:hypothetical protein